MGVNTEMNQYTNPYENWSKEIKSNNFCYHEVGRTITKWGAIEKSNIGKIIIFKG